MDAYPHAKKHLRISNLWKIILKHLCIKALTLGILWYNLYKKYIDLGLLQKYIHMERNKLQLTGPPLYKYDINGPRSWNK